MPEAIIELLATKGRECEDELSFAIAFLYYSLSLVALMFIRLKKIQG